MYVRYFMLVLWLVVASCDAPSEVEAPESVSGTLVSATSLYTLTQEEANAALGVLGLSAQYAVAVHKLVYETIDPVGAPTTASGALIIPQDLPGPAPLLSYQHGTLVRKASAPSADREGEVLIGGLFATAGYISVLPDYLGLGDGPGLHPFVHAASEASATVDMLRATRQFLANENIATTDQLYLVGISQGAHATMAALRSLEADHTDAFTVTAVSSLSGPYDISGAMFDVVRQTAPYPAPYYLPYTALSYNAIYDVFDSPTDFFADPFSTTVPPLFDGSLGAGAINDLLPEVPRDVIIPQVMNAIETNPDHPFRVAMRDNDLYDFRPIAPVRLYHCAADELVPFVNSETALAQFQAKGAQVTLTDPAPAAGHDALCFGLGLLLSKQWFDSQLPTGPAYHIAPTPENARRFGEAVGFSQR